MRIKADNTIDYKYHAVIKNTDNSFGSIVLVVFTVLLNVFLAIIIVGTIQDRDLYFFKDTLFWFIIDIYFIDQTLWYLFGKEVVLISDKLIILKKGKLFNTQKSFNFNEIISVQASEGTDTYKIQKDYLYMGGDIRINLNKGYYRFGKNMSPNEAIKISTEINEIVKELCS